MVDDSIRTLREAFEQLCEQNSAVFSKRDKSPKAQEFFRCHDVAHIVFGCDTSFLGEGTLKILTVFGTTLGFWKHLVAYREADAFALFRRYSWHQVAKDILKLIVNVPRTILHAQAMSKPWPWSDHDKYLDQSIAEIRAEFGIKVVHRR